MQPRQNAKVTIGRSSIAHQRSHWPRDSRDSLAASSAKAHSAPVHYTPKPRNPPRSQLAVFFWRLRPDLNFILKIKIWPEKNCQLGPRGVSGFWGIVNQGGVSVSRCSYQRVSTAACPWTNSCVGVRNQDVTPTN